MAEGQGQTSNWIDAIMMGPETVPETTASETPFGPSADDLLLADFAGSLEPVVEAAPEVEEETDEVETAPAEVKPEDTPNVAKRISKLVKQRKETEAALASTKAELDKFSSGFESYKQQAQQQLNQTLQSIQAQNQALRQELDGLKRPQAAPGPKKPPTTIEEWEADYGARTEAKLQEMATRMTQEALKPYQQKVAEQEAAQANAQKAAQWAAIEREADEVARNMMLKGFDPKDAEALTEATREFALTSAAAYGKTPKNAGEAQKQFLDKYFQARLRAEVAARKIVKAGSGKPSAAAVGTVRSVQASAAESDLPDYSSAQVKEAGYSNYFDALRHGFKRMKKG